MEGRQWQTQAMRPCERGDQTGLARGGLRPQGHHPGFRERMTNPHNWVRMAKPHNKPSVRRECAYIRRGEPGGLPPRPGKQTIIGHFVGNSNWHSLPTGASSRHRRNAACNAALPHIGHKPRRVPALSLSQPGCGGNCGRSDNVMVRNGDRIQPRRPLWSGVQAVLFLYGIESFFWSVVARLCGPVARVLLYPITRGDDAVRAPAKVGGCGADPWHTLCTSQA